MHFSVGAMRWISWQLENYDTTTRFLYCLTNFNTAFHPIHNGYLFPCICTRIIRNSFQKLKIYQPPLSFSYTNDALHTKKHISNLFHAQKQLIANTKVLIQQPPTPHLLACTEFMYDSDLLCCITLRLSTFSPVIPLSIACKLCYSHNPTPNHGYVHSLLAFPDPSLDLYSHKHLWSSICGFELTLMSSANTPSEV